MLKTENAFSSNTISSVYVSISKCTKHATHVPRADFVVYFLEPHTRDQLRMPGPLSLNISRRRNRESEQLTEGDQLMLHWTSCCCVFFIILERRNQRCYIVGIQEIFKLECTEREMKGKPQTR